jgi:hypothetical protein
MPIDDHDGLYEEAMQSEVAWAAGLFDGEGCFTLSDGRPRAKLNSTDEDVVQRFADIVWVGQVREERSLEKRGYKRQWEWYTGSKKDVAHIILLLWPWLGQRRREKALEVLGKC